MRGMALKLSFQGRLRTRRFDMVNRYVKATQDQPERQLVVALVEVFSCFFAFDVFVFSFHLLQLCASS